MDFRSAFMVFVVLELRRLQVSCSITAGLYRLAVSFNRMAARIHAIREAAFEGAGLFVVCRLTEAPQYNRGNDMHCDHGHRTIIGESLALRCSERKLCAFDRAYKEGPIVVTKGSDALRTCLAL
jgi:hypothetical protein